MKIRHGRSGGSTWFELPPFAPDPAVSVLAVECAEPVATQPVPTQGLPLRIGGAVIPELSDADYKSAWTAPDSTEVTVEIDLGAPQRIQCLATVEPWQIWDGIAQAYRLEALVGGVWQPLAEGMGDGTGLTLPFAPVTAQHFRVRVNNAQTPVCLREVMLFP